MDVECGEGTFIFNRKVGKNAKKKSVRMLGASLVEKNFP
jgi:hypothetical protein